MSFSKYQECEDKLLAALMRCLEYPPVMDPNDEEKKDPLRALVLKLSIKCDQTTPATFIGPKKWSEWTPLLILIIDDIHLHGGARRQKFLVWLEFQEFVRRRRVPQYLRTDCLRQGPSDMRERIQIFIKNNEHAKADAPP